MERPFELASRSSLPSAGIKFGGPFHVNPAGGDTGPDVVVASTSRALSSANAWRIAMISRQKEADADEEAATGRLEGGAASLRQRNLADREPKSGTKYLIRSNTMTVMTCRLSSSRCPSAGAVVVVQSYLSTRCQLMTTGRRPTPEDKRLRALLDQFVSEVNAWRSAEQDASKAISSWVNIASRLPLIEAAQHDATVRARVRALSLPHGWRIETRCRCACGRAGQWAGGRALCRA
jgi:hypothetical protein